MGTRAPQAPPAARVARARTRGAVSDAQLDRLAERIAERGLPDRQLERLAGLIARRLTGAEAVTGDLAATGGGSDWVDATEAAKLLQVEPSWVRSKARQGVIPNVKVGRYRRFNRDALRAWAKARETGPIRPVAGSGPVSPRRKRR